MRGYAICSAPRSGTNFFCEVLTSTGVLGRPREYFNGYGRRQRDDPTYPDDPHLQVERILTMGATGDIYALKLFPGLFDTVSPHIALTACLPDLKFVRFSRRDILGQALSWARANQTRQYRSTDTCAGSPVYDGDAIAFHILQVCQRNARWDMYFARTGIEPLEFVYEEVARDPQRSIDRLAQHLDVRTTATYRPDFMPLRKQRDALTAEWRARFLAERRDLTLIETVEDIARLAF